MKKSILLAIGCTIAVAAAAQTPPPRPVPSHIAKASTRKSVYYNKPFGTLFQVSDTTGNIMGTSYLYVPGNSWTAFTPMAAAGTTYAWHQNAYGYDDSVISFDRTGQTDEERYYTDSEGRFCLHSTFNGGNALPTIVSATDSFTLSEENPHWAPYNESTPSTMAWYPQIYSGTLYASWNFLRPLSYTDERVSSVGFGGLTTGYLFGTGSYQDNTVVEVSQGFEKPASPLWVENIYLEGVSTSETPIPAGKSLTLQLRNFDSSSGSVLPGDEVLAEFTATAADVHNYTTFTDEGTTYNQSAIVFHRPEGGITIDQDFVVVVRGFDADGVNIGFIGFQLPYYYNGYVNAATVLKNSNGRESAVSLYGDVSLQVNFTAKFDYCNAYISDGENYGVVRQSDDGKSGQAIPTARGEFPGAVVQINGNWTENGTGQYTLTGLPDWVTGYTVDDESYKQYGLTIVSFTTTALPDGVSGRSASVNIQGKGVTSADPIVILQGDVDVPSGIDKVSAERIAGDANAPMFNLAGQRVGNDYHGIVIIKGKKVKR